MALATACLLITTREANAVPVRIMPLGDSITAGYTDNPSWANHPFEFGYRSGLYTRLTNAGYDFTFVGGSQEPYNNMFGDPTRGGTVSPTLDLRPLGQDGHRGYGGQTPTFIANNISSWLTTDNPDLVLLKIGTNNFFDQAGIFNAVNTIVTQNPDVHVIVAEIIPRFTFNQNVVNLNTYIRDTLVPDFQSQGSNVYHVDMYSEFLTNTADPTSIDQSLFSNGINHPDFDGYDRMAQVWFDQIELLDLSPSFDPEDFDQDGDVDGDDWNVFIGQLFTNTSALVSDAEKLAAGDFNLDGTNDYADLAQFRTTYDLRNGTGSFASLLAAVPEPSAAMILAIGIAGLGLRRVKPSGRVAVLALAGCLSLHTAAEAVQVITTDVHGPFTPSNTTDEVFFNGSISGSDLLNGLSGTGGLWKPATAGASPDGLTDGLGGDDFDAVGNPAALTGATWSEDGDDVSFREYELGLGAGAGFDITEIQTIAGWQGAGFANQRYEVDVRFVGDDLFTELVLVDYQPIAYSDADPNRFVVGASTKVNVTDSTGTLVSGIEALRFSVLDTNSFPGGGAVYRELDVFGVETNPGPPLQLTVDRATGQITIDNRILGEGAKDREIDFYQITSAAGSLDPAGWNSFSAQGLDVFESPAGATAGPGNDPGESWNEAGSVSDNVLGEAFLLSSSTIELETGNSLGAAFAGSSAADEDLAFQYASGNGALVDGLVTYIGDYLGLDGDYNADGIVNAADYTLWRDNQGAADETTINFNGDGGGVTESDYTLWTSQYGTNAATSATLSVPEPSAGLVLMMTASFWRLTFQRIDRGIRRRA